MSVPPVNQNGGSPAINEGAPTDMDTDVPPPPPSSSSEQTKTMANTETANYLIRNRHTRALLEYKQHGIMDNRNQLIKAPMDLRQESALAGEKGQSGVVINGDTAQSNGSKSGGGSNANPPNGTKPTVTLSESTLTSNEFARRNAPQAVIGSASTSGYWAATEEFQRQAMDIINEQKRVMAAGTTFPAGGTGGAGGAGGAAPGGNAAAGTGDENDPANKGKKREQVIGGQARQMLDVTDRIRGYEMLREWVEAGLEGWKVC